MVLHIVVWGNYFLLETICSNLQPQATPELPPASGKNYTSRM